jgi:hypothetical protein
MQVVSAILIFFSHERVDCLVDELRVGNDVVACQLPKQMLHVAQRQWLKLISINIHGTARIFFIYLKAADHIVKTIFVLLEKAPDKVVCEICVAPKAGKEGRIFFGNRQNLVDAACCGHIDGDAFLSKTRDVPLVYCITFQHSDTTLKEPKSH